MIDGVSGENYDGDGSSLKGLKNDLTTFSDGKIYINEANAEVLSLIPGMDASSAESVATAHECFTGMNDISALFDGANHQNKIKQWLKFVPDYFRIIACKKVGGVNEISETVIKLKNGQIKTMLLK